MKNSKKFSNVAKKSLAVALAILSLTGSAQNVSAMKSVDQVQNNISDEAGEYWDEFAESSNKNFITGKDENGKEVVELNDRESTIYESIKEFILSEEANFGILNENFETIDLETFENGVECQIKAFTDRNEKPKAFVCVVVPDNNTFTKENMNTIKRKLSNQGLATRDGLQFDFENVNLVIRPKTRIAKFEIGENVIGSCDNSTINAQGAKISRRYAISNCFDSTINAQGATISGVKAIYICDNSTINAQGATISGKEVIRRCDSATINAQGATISGKCAILYCKNPTINVNEEQVYDVADKVYDLENVKINGRSLKEIKSEVKQQQPKEQIAKTSKSENKFSKQAVIGGVVGFLSICTITAVAFKNKIKKFFNQHIVKKDKKLNQKLTRVK